MQLLELCLKDPHATDSGKGKTLGGTGWKSEFLVITDNCFAVFRVTLTSASQFHSLKHFDPGVSNASVTMWVYLGTAVVASTMCPDFVLVGCFLFVLQAHEDYLSCVLTETVL